MNNRRTTLRKNTILFLGVVTLIYAILMPDRNQMFAQYGNLLVQKTNLVRDTFEMAGLSGAFFNASLHFFLFYYLVVWKSKTPITGLKLSALGLFVGHSFLGTHLLAVLPIILGVYLYAKFLNQSFSRYTTISIFSTAASPAVSYFIAMSTQSFGYIFVGLLAGIVIGFISPVLAEHYIKFHQGFSLYNFGFTTGIIAMFAALVFTRFGFDLSGHQHLSAEAEIWKVIYFLMICLMILMRVGTRFSMALKELPKLYQHTGRAPDDFFSSFGKETVLVNMAINGLVYLVIMLVLKVEITGPILAGLFTILGFSAFGKHLKNSLMVSVGVLFAAYFAGSDLSSLTVALPILFVTSLAPLAGYYGIIAGLIGGALHFNLVTVVFDLHNGMNLYNNGFSSGFVAAFLSPIMEIFEDYRNSREG